MLDWASRYPVGASLAFTEDSQHILVAFRNGFLNTAQWQNRDSNANVIEGAIQPFAFLPKYVYLEALASIDMVGINCSGYFVNSREGILKLGTYIQPGILGKMRKVSGLMGKYETDIY